MAENKGRVSSQICYDAAMEYHLVCCCRGGDKQFESHVESVLMLPWWGIEGEPHWNLVYVAVVGKKRRVFFTDTWYDVAVTGIKEESHLESGMMHLRRGIKGVSAGICNDASVAGNKGSLAWNLK
jgi:hypothetical protein